MSARSIIASLWSFGVLICSSGWARQSKAFLCNSRRKDKGKKWCLLEGGRGNRNRNRNRNKDMNRNRNKIRNRNKNRKKNRNRNRNRNKDMNKNRNRVEDAVESRGIYDRVTVW